jgi:hypothetical protein
VRLADGVDLAVSCQRPPALLVIEDGAVTAQVAIELAEDVSLRDAFTGRSLDVAALAKILGVDDARPLVEAFVGRGWLSLQAPTESV